jgi:hypothetical protein
VGWNWVFLINKLQKWKNEIQNEIPINRKINRKLAHKPTLKKIQDMNKKTHKYIIMNPFVFNENGSLGKNGKENGKKIQRKSK